MTTDSQPSILIVEDEPGLADLYATWLAQDYEAEAVYDGHDAIEQLDEGIDIVLLDRRMPGLSGDEVLNHIRDRGLDCRVAMVTGIEPDFDIIDMGFDDYLVKPIEKDDLYEVVENLLAHATYNDRLQESYQLVAKKTALEAEKTEEELQTSEEYAFLQQRLKELRDTLDATLEDFEDDDFIAVFREFPEGSDSGKSSEDCLS